MTFSRAAYPSDVSDDEWTSVAPDPTLLREDAGQREYSLREAFNGLQFVTVHLVRRVTKVAWMPRRLLKQRKT